MWLHLLLRNFVVGYKVVQAFRFLVTIIAPSSVVLLTVLIVVWAISSPPGETSPSHPPFHRTPDPLLLSLKHKASDPRWLRRSYRSFREAQNRYTRWTKTTQSYPVLPRVLSCDIHSAVNGICNRTQQRWEMYRSVQAHVSSKNCNCSWNVTLMSKLSMKSVLRN